MKVKAIICDMDGTLVNYPNEPFHSSWDALTKSLSDEQKKEWIRVRDFYYPRRNLYREWYKTEVALLTDISVKSVEDYLFPIPYSLGARDFFYKRNGFVRGIISSGVSLVADKIKEEFGFDFSISNSIEIKGGFFTGKGESNLNLWEKDLELLRIADEKNLKLEEIVYVGDNENDIPIFRIVGIPVAFNPKTEKTKKYVKYIIRDFRELNKIIEES